MLVQLFVLLSSFGLSYAVSCNSLTVEGGDGGGVYPSGVCVNWGSASQKYECPGEMMQYFTTLDCTGASQSVDPCAESPPPCSATATCNAAPCSYALMEVWQGVTECDDDDAPVNEDTIYMNLPQLVGANEECVNGDEGTSAKLSCSDDGYTQTMYSTSDCSGSVVQSMPGNMCYVQQGYGMATKYTCNLVAPGAEETPRPTYPDDPEPLPTPYPTYGEIIVVTDNNDPGPQPTPRPTYPTPRPTAPTPEPTPSTKPPTTATPTTGAPTEVPTTGAPTEATDNPTTAQPTPVTQDPTTAEPTTAGPTAAPQQSSRDQPGGAYAIQAANYIAFFVFAINLMMA